MVTPPNNNPATDALPARGMNWERSLGPEATDTAPLNKPSKLFATIDDELEMLRRRTHKLMSQSSASEVQARSVESLEALVLDLRQANANLTLASLDASVRETEAVDLRQRQTLFLAMLAHELRNPLAPIVTSAELLGRLPGTSPEVQALQHILQRQSRHLTRLVDDLLDISRISSNKLRICKEPLLLAQCLEHAVETCQPELDARKQVLHLDLSVTGAWIYGDPTRLAQLFSNLILNASKFSSDQRPIYLSARQDGRQAWVSVRDEGIGISQERQPHVFDLFTQGAVGEGMMAKGLGLGLNLVKTIAELHEGKVSLLSRGEGQGSEFIVTLPLLEVSVQDSPGATATKHHPVPSPVLVQTKHILLIDDHPDINLALSMLLKAEGQQVDCAMDGPSGLRMDDTEHYDVICCDIGLPGMSGYEVAQKFRARGSQARLIAISGYDQQDQKDRALAAGFDHYLVKPIFGDELLALIAHE
jgi:signal transduction histidine kinase